MKTKFENFSKYLAGIRPERQAIKAKIEEQRRWLDKFGKLPNDFEHEIKTAKKKIAELEAELSQKNQAHYEKMLEMGHELVNLAAEKAKQPLDLADIKLVNAFSLAKNAKLSYEDASGIAGQFVGNQSALRLLKSTYEINHVVSNLDHLLYDPESMTKTLNEYAFNVALQNGSPESFLRFLGRFAKYEGITDLPVVGDDDVIESARRGAGLDPTPA